jgi:formamidopyrimidine-DNA glycosylase
MPELPEVETVCLELKPLLVGKKINSYVIYDKKIRLARSRDLRSFKVVEVFRLGKQIIIALEGKNQKLFLAVHLRMTGRLIWEDVGTRVVNVKHKHAQSLTTKHLRAEFKFKTGKLCFYDTRRFGTMLLSKSLQELMPIGHDPLSPDFTFEIFKSLINPKLKQSCKQWLLRQDRLVGIGNIYASEILFDSKISPWRPVNQLSSMEQKAIFKSTQKILLKAIKHCGTTFSDFQKTTGEIGGYQRFLKVYDRASEPCKKCKTSILRVAQQGRSTFFCPICQH